MNFKISKNFVETFLFILTNPSVSICLPDNQAQKRRLSITDLIITFSPTLWAYTPDLGPRNFKILLENLLAAIMYSSPTFNILALPLTSLAIYSEVLGMNKFGLL